MSNLRYIGLKKESEYGSAEAGASTRYEDATCNIQPRLNWNFPPPVAQRAYQKRVKGLYRAQGPINSFPVTPEGIIGDLLLGVLGDETPTNPETGVYLHTFQPADTIPSYTARIGVEQAERVLPGCLVEELTLRWEAGQPVKANALIYSGWEETSTTIAESITIDTLQPITQIDDLVALTWNGDVTYGVYMSALEFTIKNNIPFNTGDLLGRSFRTIRVGQRDVTGRLTAYFDNTDVYDDFMAGTSFSFLIKTESSLAGATKRHYIGMQAADCQYTDDAAANPQPQNEPLALNAQFRCLASDLGNYEIEALLQNTITAY
jgi:hypothetical protein